MNGICLAGDEPLYSPYGYMIGECGTIYTLTQQFGHGAVLCLLYPKEAIAAGFEQPDRDFCGYHYQGFELDYGTDFPVIRISLSITGSFNIDRGSLPMNQEQRMALTKILKVQGIAMNDLVQIAFKEMTAKNAIDFLMKPVDTVPDLIIEPEETYFGKLKRFTKNAVDADV